MVKSVQTKILKLLLLFFLIDHNFDQFSINFFKVTCMTYWGQENVWDQFIIQKQYES